MVGTNYAIEALIPILHRVACAAGESLQPVKHVPAIRLESGQAHLTITGRRILKKLENIYLDLARIVQIVQ